MVAFPRQTRQGQRVTFGVVLPTGLREHIQRLAEETGLSFTQLGSFLLQEAVAQRLVDGGALGDALQVSSPPGPAQGQATSLGLAPRGAAALRQLVRELDRPAWGILVPLFEEVLKNYAPSTVPQVRDLTVHGLLRLFEACRTSSGPEPARAEAWTGGDDAPAIPRPGRNGKGFNVVFTPASFARLETLTDWTGLTATQVVTVAVRAAADGLRSVPRGAFQPPTRVRAWGEFRAYRKTSVYLSEAAVRDVALLEEDAGRSHHYS